MNGGFILSLTTYMSAGNKKSLWGAARTKWEQMWHLERSSAFGCENRVTVIIYLRVLFHCISYRGRKHTRILYQTHLSDSLVLQPLVISNLKLAIKRKSMNYIPHHRHERATTGKRTEITLTKHACMLNQSYRKKEKKKTVLKKIYILSARL